MLVDNQATPEKYFRHTLLIAVHCEDEATIKNNLENIKEEYGEEVPITVHHLTVQLFVTFLLQMPLH
jgi:dihydroorotase